MHKDYGVKILTFCLIGNILLLLLKGGIGLWTGSEALKADAANSAGDVLSGVVVLLGLRYALKPNDSDHHYGHGKMEALVSLVVGIMIIAGVCFIVYEAVDNMVSQTITEPSWFAFGAAIVSVLVKFIMFKASYAAGKKLNSVAVIASAKDNHNDIVATSGAALAIGVAFLGKHIDVKALLIYSEPVIAILISGAIVRTAITILAESSKMLLDAAPDDNTMNTIREQAESVSGVGEICWIKCRRMGRGLLVDIAVGVSGQLSVTQGHDIAEAVQDAIKDEFAQVLDVIVHINPKM